MTHAHPHAHTPAPCPHAPRPDEHENGVQAGRIARTSSPRMQLTLLCQLEIIQRSDTCRRGNEAGQGDGLGVRVCKVGRWVGVLS